MTAPTPTQRSSFFTSVIKLVSGTTIAQAITIVTAPIISRLFAPEAFGVLNLFTSLVTIIAIVICLRYEFAIVLPENEEDAANLVGLCLVISFGISLLASIFLLLVGRRLSNLLNAPNLYGFLWLIPLALLIQGLFLAMNYWNTRTRHFGRLSIARVSASLTTSALPIFLALLGHASAASLIFSYVAGSLVFAGVLGYQVLRESAGLFYRTLQRARMIANLKRYRKFPLVDSWGSFINNLSWQLPSLMLSYFFSEVVVGYYSISNRLIVLPMTLVGTSIAQVFYQRSAELRASPANLAKSVELVFRRLVAVGLFPAIIIGIAGPRLFSIIFGSGWLEAGRYAQILSPWMFVLFISSPLGILFATLERQELSLIVNSVILGTRFLALLVGGLTHNIYVTLIIWSATGVLVYGSLAFWLLKLTLVPWKSAFRAIGEFILYACVPAIVLIAFMNLLSPSPIIVVAAALVVAAAYYGIVLFRDRALLAYLSTLLPQRASSGD